MNTDNFENNKEKHHNAYCIGYRNKPEINIIVDVCEPDGYLVHSWEECVCSGTAYLYITSQKNYSEQIINHLNDVHNNLGFKRVYFDKINAYEPFITTYTEDAKGKAIYNWEQVNSIYDKVLSIGVKPFVMISAIPKAIASDLNNTNFDGGNSSAPKDLIKWKQYVKSFVNHLIERYGEEEVKSWYFQIMNEPEIGNLYWSSTFEEYLKCYDFAATGIKEVNSRIKVGPGGFACTDGFLIAEFMDHVTSSNYDNEGDQHGAPFDFINTHSYPLDRAGHIKDEFNKIDRYMVSHFGPNHNKELVISEWNTNADAEPSFVHDGTMNAAFVIRQVAECSKEYFNDPAKTRFFAFWCHSDVYNELGEPDGEFCGLFGLITRNGIRKPNYNAFKMLHMLGNSKIRLSGGNNEVNGIATYNRERIIVILYNCLYDIKKADGDYEYDRVVNLTVRNIPWPMVKVEHYRIDELRSNSFTAWRMMGSPKDCSEEQLEYLRRTMDLELLEEASIINIITGVYNARFELPMPSISMIVLTPVEKEFAKPARNPYRILGSL